VAAQATLDVQLLDDPVEFQDPQPDPQRLEEIAHASGGTMLHNAGELAHLLQSLPRAPDAVLVSRAPVWDHAGLWLMVLALLTTEWVLRRLWGLA
jgi:hypothetical protein